MDPTQAPVILINCRKGGMAVWKILGKETRHWPDRARSVLSRLEQALKIRYLCPTRIGLSYECSDLQQNNDPSLLGVRYIKCSPILSEHVLDSTCRQDMMINLRMRYWQ